MNSVSQSSGARHLRTLDEEMGSAYPLPSVARVARIALLITAVGLGGLVGWAVLSARGKAIPFFGLNLPPLMGEDKDLGRQIMEFHELGGNLGYLLIGGHAAAALFHHYVVKDNTLRRMGFR